MTELYVKLSVNFPDDPKVIAAGEKAETLFIRGLLKAKQLLTDGFVDDVHLPRFGLAGVEARARRLVEVGLWERVAGGYRIVSWEKWNRSRADVTAGMERQRKASVKGNHKRWHKDNPDPECPLCHRVPDPLPDTKPDPLTVAVDNPRRSPETETETETETSSSSSVSDLQPALPGPKAEEEEDLIRKVATLLAEKRLAERSPALPRVGMPAAWLETTADQAFGEIFESCHRVLAVHPKASPGELLRLVDWTDAPASPSSCRPDLPACESCDSTGWLESDAGMVPCSECERVRQDVTA